MTFHILLFYLPVRLAGSIPSGQPESEIYSIQTLENWYFLGLLIQFEWFMTVVLFTKRYFAIKMTYTAMDILFSIPSTIYILEIYFLKKVSLTHDKKKIKPQTTFSHFAQLSLLILQYTHIHNISSTWDWLPRFYQWFLAHKNILALRCP